MKSLAFCLLLLPTTIGAFAQNDIKDYSIRHFTSENGLSQNSVKSMGCDEYGFIWLATESGLLRFDGSNFRQFDKNNTSILTSRMLDIRRSPDGKKLLAISAEEELLLASKGVAYKSKAAFNDLFLPGAAKHLHFKAIKRLHRQAKLDSLFFNINARLGALVVFQKGIVWYTDKGDARVTQLPLKEREELFPLDGAVYRAAPGLTGDTLQRITPEGIHRVPIRGDFLKQRDRGMLKHCLVESYPANAQTFLYADDHLYLVQAQDDGSVFTRLLLSGFDLVRHHVYCAYFDSTQRRLFIGSLVEGLYIFDRKNFHTAVYQGPAERPMINVVYDQVPINDSSVLTGNGVVACSHPALAPAYRGLPGYIPLNAPYSRPLFRSRDGHIWVGALDTLYQLRGVTNEVQNSWGFPQPAPLTEDRFGRIWFSTKHQGLYLLDPGQPHAQPRLQLPVKDQLLGMEWEGNELLWICTWRHLLRHNTSTGTTDTLHALTNKMTRGLYIPRPGEVWICTYEDGLFLWQKGELTHFPTRNYPHLKTVHKILEDDRGFFWISTNYGLYQARRADLLAYARSKGKSEEPYFHYYSRESGFLTNEFNGGSQGVGVRLNNGYFSLSSMNGVVFFRPNDITPDLPEGKIIIDKLEVDGQQLRTNASPVVLNRHFRMLKITPVSAYMGNPANLKYEFRLNDDTEWRSTYNGVVILSSLPAGSNEIFIRKQKGFGAGNHAGCKITLYVPLAWWQTRWFYVAAGAGLVLLVWLVIRLRTRHWKKRNLLLEKAILNRTQDLKNIIRDLERSENRLGEQLQFQRMLNENITHDITTPLKYLTIFTSNVLAKGNEQEGYRKADIEHIHTGANRIYEVVQNFNQYMRSRISKNFSRTRLNLYLLVEQKAVLFRIAAAERNNIIDNLADPQLFIHQNESLISIIVHNLIDNAVKNTENGRIAVYAVSENNRVQLSVVDTGRGMTPAQIQACNAYFLGQPAGDTIQGMGFGFLIIREIAGLLRLNIEIEAMPEKGLKLIVLIPHHEP